RAGTSEAGEVEGARDRGASSKTPAGWPREAALRSTMSCMALAGLAVLLGTLAQVGCGTPRRECQSDSDCGCAAKCDPEYGVCFRLVENPSCTRACEEWEFCSEDSCYPRYQGIVVLEPAAGTVDGGAAVRAQLQGIADWISVRQHAKLEYVTR